MLFSNHGLLDFNSSESEDEYLLEEEEEEEEEEEGRGERYLPLYISIYHPPGAKSSFPFLNDPRLVQENELMNWQREFQQRRLREGKEEEGRSLLKEKKEEFQKKTLERHRNRSALVIQRALRRYLQAKRRRSAVTIKKFLDRCVQKKHARAVKEKLVSLLQLRHELEGLRALHIEMSSKQASAPLTPNQSKELLVYEDSLLKFIIKLDAISSGGSDIVRDVRKSLVTRVQELLSQIDHVLQPPNEPKPIEPKLVEDDFTDLKLELPAQSDEEEWSQVNVEEVENLEK